VRIRQGHVEARPWRSGMDTACGSCPYGALCRFGVREPKKYRQLLSNEMIDNMLGQAGEGGGNGMDE
jgi:hypothetical protein